MAQESVPQASGTSALQVEMAGADIIADADRKGKPRDLFWPWFAANISVLGIAYGSYILGFGVSFAQATIAGVIGIIFSFLLCGVVALAGKRGGAPTMVLSRAALGVKGNRMAVVISWVLTVGWETVLTSMAVLAASTVLSGLGVDQGGQTGVKVIALIVVVVLIVGGGIMGFNLIMKMQTVITIVTGVLTIGYFVLTFSHINLTAVMSLPSGPPAAFIGGLVFMMTGFGLGWVNMAADYSRYLPRSTSSGGVVWWTTFGAAIAPLVLVVFGLLLAGSDNNLNQAIENDPIGALTTILPTWYLIPFAIVAILGLVGGAVLDIYSSGLALVSAGIPIPRPAAAAIDGCIMIAGTIYIVFGGTDFSPIFQGFLITLGVPIAAWAGVMLADVLMRKRSYSDTDLFDPKGRYGSISWVSIVIILLGTGIGWGFVTNSAASWLAWQGYLLGIIGGKDGDWAYANLGVLFALVIGFVATLIFRHAAVRKQEELPTQEDLR